MNWKQAYEFVFELSVRLADEPDYETELAPELLKLLKFIKETGAES